MNRTLRRSLPPSLTAVLLMTVLAAFALQAKAAPTAVISNVNATEASAGWIGNSMAVKFTTNSTAHVATSAEVKIYNSDATNSTLNAWLYSDAAGTPGAAVATFTPVSIPPSNFIFNNKYTLTLATPYKMAVSTSYWLVIQLGSPLYSWEETATAPTGDFTYGGTKYYSSGNWLAWGGTYYKKWALIAELSAPKVSFSPPELQFGDVEVGTTSVEKTVTITNTGYENLILGSLSVSESVPSGVTIVPGNDHCSSQTLAPTGTCTVGLTFSPPALDSFNPLLAIPSNVDTAYVPLLGRGIDKRKMTFRSIASYDGWVLESTEFSKVGGSLDSSANTFALGDDAQDRQFRAVLSFNTSALENYANITRVTLKIRKSVLVGSNPFGLLGTLKVDIRKPFFGMGVGLAAHDYQATAGKLGAGTFKGTPVDNWYTALIGSAGYSHINLGGTTQFRLRFSIEDNDDRGADYMKFYSGNYGTATARPLLIIDYFVTQ